MHDHACKYPKSPYQIATIYIYISATIPDFFVFIPGLECRRDLERCQRQGPQPAETSQLAQRAQPGGVAQPVASRRQRGLDAAGGATGECFHRRASAENHGDTKDSMCQVVDGIDGKIP